MEKKEVALNILSEKQNKVPFANSAKVFAPTNIALCKYWGKRDQILNLPATSSLSISLGKKGSTTEIKLSDTAADIILFNNNEVDLHSDFYKRLVAFLDLFQPNKRTTHFYINTLSNIPTAAGLASSASGFAAIVKALDQLYKWQLNDRELSILARLGSGSACRSIWQGFVEWQRGIRTDGMDSHGVPLKAEWPDFCVGLCIISDKEKHISSRKAMQRTVETSPFYAAWPEKVRTDLVAIKTAIKNKDFELIGKTAESNAMAMHATMVSAWPPVSYALPETVLMMKKIWELREQGLQLYFTQDAGPNLKLLFLKKNIDIIYQHFISVEIIEPFHANK